MTRSKSNKYVLFEVLLMVKVNIRFFRRGDTDWLVSKYQHADRSGWQMNAVAAVKHDQYKLLLLWMQ